MSEINRFSAYMAKSEKGIHLHVIGLPGCFARGRDENEALENLAHAIRVYFIDLQRHGAADKHPIIYNIHIAERSDQATGPFDPGDTSALFEPETAAISREEILNYFGFAEWNRNDLVSLAGGLPDKLLDWQPADTNSFTIRKILHHIGNGEKWYTSRIVQPEDLPPEWATDSEMPIYEFLEMTRKDAKAIFLSLNEDLRTGTTLYPQHFTSNPTEPWTVRKALRRFLEHEREHIGHIREVLEDRRQHLITKLNETREDIISIADKLSISERTSLLVTGRWTLKDVIGHLADWEKIGVGYVKQALSGEKTGKLAAFEEDKIDDFNALLEKNRRGQNWDLVWQDYMSTRSEMIALLENCTGDDLTIRLVPPWGGEEILSSFFRDWSWHDEEHIKMIRSETQLPR